MVRLRHRTLTKGHVWATAHSEDVENVEISNPSANTDECNADLATGSLCGVVSENTKRGEKEVKNKTKE